MFTLFGEEIDPVLIMASYKLDELKAIFKKFKDLGLEGRILSLGVTFYYIPENEDEYVVLMLCGYKKLEFSVFPDPNVPPSVWTMNRFLNLTEKEFYSL